MRKSIGLSKSRITVWRQCERRGWLEVHRPEEKRKDTLDLKIRFFWGNHLNEIVRTQYPAYRGGVLIGHPENPSRALAETQKVMAEENSVVLFEPAFAAGNVLVRVDVLKRNGSAWELIEIKSSTGVKDYHYEDCAVQVWVLEQASLPVSRIVLAHPNRDFVYQGDGNYQGLLLEEDITNEVRNLLSQVPAWIEGTQKTISGPEPKVEPGPHCRKPFGCPFTEYCDRSFGLDFPVWRLPYANMRGFLSRMLEKGIREVAHIPPEEARGMDSRARPIWEGLYYGREIVKSELREALGHLPYPRFYFDFETVSFVVPVWKGTRPYQNVPFQWSCHIEKAPGVVEHRKYIDLSGFDPRPGVINSLVRLFGSTEGPIIVYGDYEERIFRELARDFPVFREFFESLIRRVVNLYKPVSKGYRHPKLRSFSLKSVVPAAIPDFSYDDLDIAEGSMAPLAYLKLFYEKAPVTEIERYRQALLSYCKRDTEALYLLVRELQKR